MESRFGFWLIGTSADVEEVLVGMAGGEVLALPLALLASGLGGFGFLPLLALPLAFLVVGWDVSSVESSSMSISADAAETSPVFLNFRFILFLFSLSLLLSSFASLFFLSSSSFFFFSSSSFFLASSSAFATFSFSSFSSFFLFISLSLNCCLTARSCLKRHSLPFLHFPLLKKSHCGLFSSLWVWDRPHSLGLAQLSSLQRVSLFRTLTWADSSAWTCLKPSVMVH